ncbi:AmmeMemoRadiSam system radical SAM enzyme [bacterium]|nr:AmmeMemoRadiSam system radical SAM enzyme [bacterium]
MHRAAYWEKQGNAVQCRLCPHQCVIPEGKVGRCGIRQVQDGILWAIAYGKISASSMDPIEKKPFFHVKPGKKIYSIGSAGCNLKCDFCQNWPISQKVPSMNAMAPLQVAEQAIQMGACGVAYTYNEPLINSEFILACARIVREKGLINVVVTNGYVASGPLNDLLEVIDAWNIDIKSMQDGFYKRRCCATLAPVLATIRRAAEKSHVELTHLMVTGENDAMDQVRELVAWIADVSPELPLHLTRYFPQYRSEESPTDPEKLLAAREIAREKLKWVYLGNLSATDDSTYCPDCGEILISRQGYQVEKSSVHAGRCTQCQRVVPGIF